MIAVRGRMMVKKTIYINYILILLIYINAKIKIFRNIALLQLMFMIEFI